MIIARLGPSTRVTSLGADVPLTEILEKTFPEVALQKQIDTVKACANGDKEGQVCWTAVRELGVQSPSLEALKALGNLLVARDAFVTLPGIDSVDATNELVETIVHHGSVAGLVGPTFVVNAFAWALQSHLQGTVRRPSALPALIQGIVRFVQPEMSEEVRARAFLVLSELAAQGDEDAQRALIEIKPILVPPKPAPLPKPAPTSTTPSPISGKPSKGAVALMIGGFATFGLITLIALQYRHPPLARSAR